MKHIINALLIFALIAISSSRLATDVPLAAWSGATILNGQNIGITRYISQNEVEKFLESLLYRDSIKDGELSKYIQDVPEVVVLFLEPKLRSEYLSVYSSSFTTLKQLLPSEVSSIYAPYIDLSASLRGSVASIARTTKQESGSVIYFGKGSILFQDIRSVVPSTVISSIGNAKETLEDNSQIFNNGVVDLIVVNLDSNIQTLENRLSESDSMINTVQTLVSDKTTKYINIYTALAYDIPELKMEFSHPQIKAKRYYMQAPGFESNNSGNGTLPVFRQYFGGWFWELFLVCLVLIPLLVSGVYCIDSIQTPIFDVKPKPKPKIS